jgi:YHS domain-containing protein
MFRACVLPAIAAASLLGLATAALAVTGEFGNRCAMSLVNGKDTPTDCSINESYGGHTYCFGSQEAHDVFMKSPAENLAKAQANYATMFPSKAQEK